MSVCIAHNRSFLIHSYFQFSGHRHWVLCIAWAPNGRKVASACKLGEVPPLIFYIFHIAFCIMSLFSILTAWLYFFSTLYRNIRIPHSNRIFFQPTVRFESGAPKQAINWAKCFVATSNGLWHLRGSLCICKSSFFFPISLNFAGV